MELGYLSNLNWLEYSLKLSLWIECVDVIEQEMGTEQVIHTLSALEEYQKMTVVLENRLNDEDVSRIYSK
ncbi:hypothetical protein [Paenibacillus sp. 4624]|uniref:hypothetical protein n=1 Tax=Paenibacillus sp. 4624 TaxID=3156453 RepID=UPI003D1DD62E